MLPSTTEQILNYDVDTMFTTFYYNLLAESTTLGDASYNTKV